MSDEYLCIETNEVVRAHQLTEDYWFRSCCKWPRWMLDLKLRLRGLTNLKSLHLMELSLVVDGDRYPGYAPGPALHPLEVDDWVILEPSGELMSYGPDAFAEKYTQIEVPEGVI